MLERDSLAGHDERISSNYFRNFCLSSFRKRAGCSNQTGLGTCAFQGTKNVTGSDIFFKNLSKTLFLNVVVGGNNQLTDGYTGHVIEMLLKYFRMP